MELTQGFGISLFGGKTDNRPKAGTKSMDELRGMLMIFELRKAKDGALWSPTLYTEGATRGIEGVISVSCLVLDFDDGYAVDDFLGFWKPWSYFVHSTFSSRPDSPKWRAVFPLKTPIARDDWAKVYEKLAIRFGHGATDPSCIDPSRIYYLPSCPEELEAFSFKYENAGDLLDPSTIADPDYDEPERAALNGQAKPGEDYDARAHWEDILSPRGWIARASAYRGQTLWTRPGKSPKDGPSAKTGPGPYGERFFCWSSAAGVPENRALTKFGLLAHLEYGGDYGKCAKALAKQGYGTPAPKTPTTKIPAAAVISGPRPIGEYFDPRTREYRPYHGGDLGNAERFITLFGTDMRYVAGTGWFVWDSERWRKHEEGALMVRRLAHRMPDRLLEAAIAQPVDDKKQELVELARKMFSARTLGSMISMAETFSQVEAKLEDFDRDPWTLGCTNGTLDLRTKTLRKPSAADMITMRTGCPYEPQETPAFLKFFEEAMLGRAELMRFVMLSLGYSITGDMAAQVFWFCSGSGDNGKGVLMQLLEWIMGTYASVLQPESIMVRRNEQIPADLAKLQGRRFVTIPEVNDDKRINESLVKQITGGDTITARFLRENFVDFRPNCKLWLSGNQNPQVRNFDHAFRRRIRVIPFDYQVSDANKDTRLGDKLREEGPGVLWLLVLALEEYLKVGLPVPTEVYDAVEAYEKESDIVGAFIAEECDLLDSSIRCEKKRLRTAFIEWCKAAGMFPLSRNRFYDQVKAHGIELADTVTHGDYPFVGIRLKKDAPQ